MYLQQVILIWIDCVTQLKGKNKLDEDVTMHGLIEQTPHNIE